MSLRLRRCRRVGVALLFTGLTSVSFAACTGSTGSTVKVAALHGVRIQVPTSWRIRDGSTAPLCSAGWPLDPTVYVGRQTMAASCGASTSELAGPGHELNGVWLRPAPPLNPEFSRYVLPYGQEVGVIRPFSGGPGCTLLFHGVIVAVGPLTPELAAKSVLASLSYRR